MAMLATLVLWAPAEPLGLKATRGLAECKANLGSLAFKDLQAYRGLEVILVQLEFRVLLERLEPLDLLGLLGLKAALDRLESKAPLVQQGFKVRLGLLDSEVILD